MEPETVYSTNVRLGNWYEEICLEEDEIFTFLKQRRKNQLVVQKTRQLFSNFFKEIELEAPAIHIRFGAIVQIAAARMKLCKNPIGNDSLPKLSIVINDKMIHKSQRISDKCEITLAPSTKSCARNSFLLKSGDNKDRTNELLKYGQDFSIECIDAEENPLNLCSVQKSADLSTMIVASYDSFHRGQINLPVGLILKKNTGPGKPLPSAYARWRCQHVDPYLRFEMEGKHVQSNTPLLITHSATNQNLSAENIQVPTIFGPECLVACKTHIDTHKVEQWQNVWMIVIGNKQNID